MDRQFAFCSFRFDPRTGELWGDGKQARLTPRAAAVFTMLAECAPELVSKQELFERVWHGLTVGDDALTSCIQELRQALGDDARAPRYIETRHRRGYRLVEPITVIGEDAVLGAPRAAHHQGSPSAPSGPSVDRGTAVRRHERRRRPGALCRWRTEELITGSVAHPLAVRHRPQLDLSIQGQAPRFRQVGRELGVRYVLEGSVRRQGKRLRLTAQLIDAIAGGHHWAERYDRELGDIFAVQDEITRTWPPS